MSTPKKILFVLHLPPPIHGSAMVGEYINSSHKLNSMFSTRYINLGTSKSIDEIGKNPLKKIFIYINILFSLIKQLLFFRPNMVYIAMTAQGVGFYKDVVLAFIVKLFGVSLVYHFHNKGVALKQHKYVDNILYTLAFKGAKNILLSKYLYTDIKKYVKEENVWYCPNGIPDLNKLLISSKVNNVPNILFLSNLIVSKGVYVLLDTLKTLKDKGVKFNCNFVGGEGDVSRKQFELYVNSLGLQENVTYLGKKYDKEKLEIFSQADIFVHPSSSDCFPLVLLEAFQFGLPVISTYEGAIPEIVKDGTTGFLVPSNDVEELSNGIEKLIMSNELRLRMGKAARESYVNNYTLRHFEQNIVHVLKEILNTK